MRECVAPLSRNIPRNDYLINPERVDFGILLIYRPNLLLPAFPTYMIPAIQMFRQQTTTTRCQSKQHDEYHMCNRPKLIYELNTYAWNLISADWKRLF